jgi:hypothetical protein
MKRMILTAFMVFVVIGSAWAGEWHAGYGSLMWRSGGCSGIFDHSKRNLSRQRFEWEYKFKALEILLNRLEHYKEVVNDYEAIKRISNENTKMAQMEQLRQKLINLCGNSSSPQCAEVKEALDRYRQCMAKIGSEWDSYNDPDPESTVMKREAKKQAEEQAEEQAKAEQKAKLLAKRKAELLAEQEKLDAERLGITVEQLKARRAQDSTEPTLK